MKFDTLTRPHILLCTFCCFFLLSLSCGRLVATGQLLMALKKVSERRLSRSRSGRGGNIDRHSEDHIQKAIERLQQVRAGEGEARPRQATMRIPHFPGPAWLIAGLPGSDALAF